MANDVIKQSENTYKTMLVKQNETYTNMLTNSLNSMDIEFSAYKKTCVMSCLSVMATMLRKDSMDFKDIEPTNITSILQQVALLEINLATSPREGYLQFRKSKVTDKDGKEFWVKEFELGIEGNGNDTILRKYGVDLVDVRGPYIIREGDEFTYPSFDGEKMLPPTWLHRSYYGRAMKVVYIATKTDGSKDYLIAEREGVVYNLRAHINQNLMNVTDKEVKKEIINKIATLSLDEILNDLSLRSVTFKSYNQYKKIDEEKTVTLISSAWLAPHSQEAMIERKMKNNATKKYPKDFKNAYVESAYEDTFEDYSQYRERPVYDYSNEDKEIKSIEEHETEIDQNNASKPIENKKVVEELIPSTPKKGDIAFQKIKASEDDFDEGF